MRLLKAKVGSFDAMMDFDLNQSSHDKFGYKIALLDRTGPCKYRVMTPWVWCKEYFNDVLVAYKVRRRVSVYGFVVRCPQEDDDLDWEHACIAILDTKCRPESLGYVTNTIKNINKMLKKKGVPTKPLKLRTFTFGTKRDPCYVVEGDGFWMTSPTMLGYLVANIRNELGKFVGATPESDSTVFNGSSYITYPEEYHDLLLRSWEWVSRHDKAGERTSNYTVHEDRGPLNMFDKWMNSRSLKQSAINSIKE